MYLQLLNKLNIICSRLNLKYMSFTVSGSIITQANESGIPITAAASITGGVRFTCTQSYVVGNVVRITGTTSYNGNWMVAAVTGTTFDVLESAQGTAITFVSTQTGTAARGDSSLAGISGLTGVTRTTLDASSGYVVYLLGDNVKLQINGTLIIGGLREINTTRLGQNEQLVIGQNAISTVQPVLRVGSGGVLVVGCRYTNTVNYTGSSAPQYTDGISQQVLIYQKGHYGRSTADGDGSTLPATNPAPVTAFMGISNGARFDWVSGTIDCWGDMSFDNGSTVNIGFEGMRNKPVMDSRRGSNVIWFKPGSSVSIFALKGIGDRGINVTNVNNTGRGPTFQMLQGPAVFKGFEGFWWRCVVGLANGTGVGGAFTIEDYAGALGSELDITKAVQSGQTLNVTFKNSAVGTTMVVVDASLGTVLLYVTQKLTATVRTTGGAAIQDAVVWTISNVAVQSLGVTNVSGVTVIDNIETGFSPDNQASVTPRFAAGDVATWNVRAYGSLSAVYQVTMKGIGGSVVEPAMVNDSAVTLSRSAAASLSTIPTLDNFYDAAKYWNVQSANVNYPTATTQVATAAGTTLDLGALNVLVDATAGSAFAVNTGTNTVTIKSTTLAIGSKFNMLKTTGTISFANGSDATCLLQGIVVRGTTGVYSPKLESATMRFTTAGTYDLRNAIINGTLTLTNTSGGTVTVQLQPSVTFVNSGPNITVDNTVNVALTITNVVSGSDIVVLQAGTETVLDQIDQNIGSSWIYNYQIITVVDIFVSKAGYVPFYIRNYSLPSNNASLPITQIIDRNYTA
jgi:hypothetical protein